MTTDVNHPNVVCYRYRFLHSIIRRSTFLLLTGNVVE